MPTLMEQYNQTCAEFPEAIVLIRVLDFYEAYGETAKELAETLGLTLTQRDSVPMSGIPFHAVERRIAELITSGKKVILLDHAEDPHRKDIDEIIRDLRHISSATSVDGP
jgi:DNA mismatch repair protein MutS